MQKSIVINWNKLLYGCFDVSFTYTACSTHYLHQEHKLRFAMRIFIFVKLSDQWKDEKKPIKLFPTPGVGM